MTYSKLNLPILLTLIRLVGSPLILPILFVYLLPLENRYINFLLAFLFVLFSITDFLDGYLARKLQQETQLGRVLDPMADKFLFFSVVVALVYIHKIFFYWAILFIGREFFVLGLRILALEHGFSIVVSKWGKLKTAVQLVYLTFVIIGSSLSNYPIGQTIALWQDLFLLFALAATIGSGIEYYRSFMKLYLAQH